MFAGGGSERAWGGHTSRIQGIDIDAQIDGLLRPDAFSDLPDDAMHANGVNLARLDDLEAAVTVILVVRGAGERGADAGVDVAVVGEETFLAGVVEVGAVVDAGLFGRGTAEDLRPPCVAVVGLSNLIRLLPPCNGDSCEGSVGGEKLTGGCRNGSH